MESHCETLRRSAAAASSMALFVSASTRMAITNERLGRGVGFFMFTSHHKRQQRSTSLLYSIAELFGHTTLVGRIEEIERFVSKMPAIEPLYPRYAAAGAVPWRCGDLSSDAMLGRDRMGAAATTGLPATDRNSLYRAAAFAGNAGKRVCCQLRRCAGSFDYDE
jgi:hypothetical protein